MDTTLANGIVNGYAAFRFTAGSSDNQALVPLETRTTGAYLVGFDNTNGFVTGIALANTSSEAASIGMVIRDDNGTTIYSSSIPVAALSHTAFVLPSMYGITVSKRGSVEFDAPSGMQIGTLGIQFNTASEGFSTVPALAK